jgi:hypothetical protein
MSPAKAGLAAVAIPAAIVAGMVYLTCLAQGWGFSSDNPMGSISWGHRIAAAVSSGVSPLDERDYVYYNSDIPSLVRANVMVNCATGIYLGYGPGSVPQGETA